MSHRLSAILLVALGLCPFSRGDTSVLRIDLSRITAQVSSLHAGLMTEEINHAYDGGLYGELISNHAFQDGVRVTNPLPPHWALVQDGTGAASYRLDSTEPCNSASSETLRFDAIAASPGNRVGLANDGYWGIPIKAGTRYRTIFWARSPSFPAALTLAIESADGTKLVETKVRLVADSSWHRYDAILETPANLASSSHNRFIVSTEAPGIFWLSYVSLFGPTYNDRTNGNRPDIMEKLAALRPAFLRFPGGDYLEGDSLANHFPWRKTLGPVTERPGHEAPWGYRSSDGLGLLEFLTWCEDLHMEPILGLFAGNCHNSTTEFVLPGEKLQPYVDEALQEIEYVTGGPDTIWGAARARDGHPAPFHLIYVEIGNEDVNQISDYEGRFAQFYDAIKAKYPHLQVIASTRVKSRTPDVVDEHFYRRPETMMQDVHHYDTYDRKGPKIFVGEWASVEGEPTPNLNAALGDAAWMTGMERNSDLVIMQAYAPLLANVNEDAYQWRTNLIGYDALTSYGSPSYYAQVMFNTYRGDVVPECSPSVAPGFFTSVTKDTKTGTIYIKAVNGQATARTVKIEIVGVTVVEGESRQVVLTSASPTDTNTLKEPEKVVPIASTLIDAGKSFEHTFPAYSISVLEIPAK